MGEPSRAASGPHKESVGELLKLLQHEFPQAKLEQIGDTWAVYTVHGVGKSEEEAVTNAFKELNRMQSDGRSLPQMLDDIRADLAEKPGMSKDRHASLTELLDIASNCLNDGILTQTVPWIMEMTYNRQIEDLRKRVDGRLAMTAKEMADREAAQKKAASKPEKTGAEYIPGKGVVRPAAKGGLWALFQE